jgi:hypothetical protein
VLDEVVEQEGKVMDDPWQKGACSSLLFAHFLLGSILVRPLANLLSHKPGIHGMLVFQPPWSLWM